MTSGAPPKLVVWSDDLSVGIGTIDAQHQKWIGLINDLNAAVVSGRGSAFVGRTLVGLLAYTSTHFVHEEKLMQESAYPGLEEHKVEHARLVAAVRELQSDLRAGKSAVSVDVMHFLKSWLLSHIRGLDQKYASHLQEAGAK